MLKNAVGNLLKDLKNKRNTPGIEATIFKSEKQ
jgi:hypothetical protein